MTLPPHPSYSAYPPPPQPPRPFEPSYDFQELQPSQPIPPPLPRPQPLPPARNGMGVTGLVLGIIALVFAFIPIVGIIAWFIWPAGLLFAGLGLVRCQQGTATNRGVTIGGLATGAAAALVCVLWLLVFGAYAASQPAGSTDPAASTSHAPTPTAAAAPVKPSGPATSIGDGTYQVGTDIAAGRYKTPGPDPDAVIKYCYWARTRDDSGDSAAILANGNTNGPGSVTVKQGEFFTVSGDCTWTKS